MRKDNVMKCVLILPYFGKLNDYFPLFLRSCSSSKLCDWLFFTDDRTEYDYPSNVHVKYTTFDWIKQLIQSKFKFRVSLDTPYKLCDFKPTYGFVFSEYLEGYDYWGHCDSDVVFGNLDKYLNPLFQNSYDKLFAAGHLTIYKNDESNNTRFMNPYNGRYLYKEFLTVPQICWFDEDWKSDNIHTMFLSEGTKVYPNVLAFNPSGKYAYFIQRNYSPSDHKYIEEKYRKALYIWCDGKFFRQYELDGRLVEEEFLYLHLQHRRMSVDKAIYNSKYIQVVPNKFIPLDHVPSSLSDWNRIKLEPVSAYLYVLNNQCRRVIRKINKLRGKR